MNPWTGNTATFSWKLTNDQENRGYSLIKIQGILALVDCGPNDGGFHCVPGFNKHLRGWANQNLEHFNPKNYDTTIQVPRKDPIRFDIQKVPIRKGSILVWMSSLPHGAFPNDSERIRMIQYIKAADVNDTSLEPLNNDLSLLPPDFQLTELGKKILGF